MTGRKQRRALAWAAVALFLSLGLARLHDYRGWDQSFYLAQTSSLAEDGDVDLRNDLLHLQREPATLLRALTNLEPNGALGNTFAIGTSLLWLPPYAVTMPWRGLTAMPHTRWGRPQLAALQLFTLGLMVWLLWVFDRWLRRMGVGRWLAALGAFSLVVGTPLLVYGFRAYMGSHQASAVAVMLLVTATLRLGDRGSTGSAWLWGVALGLVFLCRWQDAAKGLLLLVPVLQLWRRGLSPGRWVALAGATTAGALVTAGVQLHAWLLERGEIFALPQGPSYLDLSAPQIGRFLLSGLSGLVPWSPLFLIAGAGLLLPWRSRLHPAWRWVALAVLLFDIYLNAAVDDWWGGVAYGPRRMVSDLPLLAIGLGNLAAWRRLRTPLAVALALCCLWGGITSNLRVHGLRDLSILVHGRPSAAPGAEREKDAQPSQAEALEVATSWPARPGKMSYFAGSWRPGRAVTVALGALACLLVGGWLGRARAPDRLGAALWAVFALALFAHGRLLASEPAGFEERLHWARLSRFATGSGAAPPSADTADAGEARNDRYLDARRFLLSAAHRRGGRREEARRLIADRGPYPFTPHLLEALSLEPGERLLVARRGFFHQVRRGRPGRSLALGRRMDLACEALSLGVEIEAAAAPESAGTLVALGRRGAAPLARVEIVGREGVALRTAGDGRKTSLAWSREARHRLELEWDPRVGKAELTVTAPSGESSRLGTTADPSAAGEGRFEVVIGPMSPPAGGEPPWGTRYYDLRLTARDVCGEPPAAT